MLQFFKWSSRSLLPWCTAKFKSSTKLPIPEWVAGSPTPWWYWESSLWPLRGMPILPEVLRNSVAFVGLFTCLNNLNIDRYHLTCHFIQKAWIIFHRFTMNATNYIYMSLKLSLSITPMRMEKMHQVFLSGNNFIAEKHIEKTIWPIKNLGISKPWIPTQPIVTKVSLCYWKNTVTFTGVKIMLGHRTWPNIFAAWPVINFSNFKLCPVILWT